MNDFKRVNELNEQTKKRLNSLYENLDNDIINDALKICGFSGENSQKIAILRRIVDLKVDPLLNEFKKLNYDENKILELRDKMFDFTREFHMNLHKNLIAKIKEEKILDDFNLALLDGVHNVGEMMNDFMISWQKKIIDTTNSKFQKEFSTIKEASEFLKNNNLFQKDGDEICDRSYGAIVKNGEKFEFLPYILAFDEVKNVVNSLNELIINLEKLSKNDENLSYVKYFKKLKEAFACDDNEKIIFAWQECERAWMDVKGEIQVGHPLEYYEDAYTHAVAPEWDIRLKEVSNFDEVCFKENIKDTFFQIYKNIGANNEAMKNLVISNIDKTQIYISSPMLYYGAELNGLFSAQVVPNDEVVSKKFGKKIFAFVNFIYESAKSKPFMRISKEIFDEEFLNYGREILFSKPGIWKKVYEISTIGHEFGHILFIDCDSEAKMNKSGVFKFIEEYKATTGGLVNFFLHEDEKYKMPVFDELIKRSVGLIAWQKVDEVRAYYCEGLIHLSLLFDCEVLKFENKKISVDFSNSAYEKFKNACLKNYEDLAKIYHAKQDAREFLDKFAVFEDGIYLPKNEKCKEFVKFYHDLYEKIGNEIDETSDKSKWMKISE